MKKRRMKLTSMLLASLMVVSLAACSSGGGTDESGSGDNAPQASTETKEAHSAMDITPDDPQAVNVVIADNDTFTTCDDFNNFSLANKILERLWGDPLIELNYDTREYTGVVAESWEWDESGTVVTVKIRDGITFSNGEELTAEDVAFSYERIITDDSLANTARWNKMTGAEVTGEDEVQISFNAVMPNFEPEAVFVPIICKSAYEADPDHFFDGPVGSGPYVWYSTDFTNNTGTLQRRDEWWGYDFYDKEPSNVDFITYEIIDEDTTRVSSLRTGEVNICRALPFDQIEIVESDGLQTITTDLARNTFLCLNCHEGSVFADEKIREALSLCIDRELITESILGSGKPSKYVFPDNCTGYNPDGATGYEYDVEKAKELLEEAGYNGEEIKFDIASGIVSRGVETAQAIQAMASEAGFNMTINQMESAAYNDARFGGDYTMQLCNFINTEGDSFVVMNELLGNIDIFQTGFVDQEVWDLIDEASVTVDAEERESLQREAYDKIFANFAPYLYLIDEQYALGVSSDITGLELKFDMLMELRFLQRG